ncbi:hypothetical protein D8883_06025 [Streptococcus sanguinis]|nr:hypothetical protein D8883_06025 [Streptococcus sanguinis]
MFVSILRFHLILCIVVYYTFTPPHIPTKSFFKLIFSMIPSIDYNVSSSTKIS